MSPKSLWSFIGGTFGALAYFSGLTQTWIIEPIADGFDGLSEGAKVLVVFVLLGAFFLWLATSRRRRKTLVRDAAPKAL